MNKKIEVAVFGGGCFWCTEALFGELRGIVSVLSGYAGGNKINPTYEEVCGGKTGHAEVIKIEYNPEVIGYNDLLTVFFATHDPTTLNRQGNDAGEQYRSVIFYTTDEQRRRAEDFIKKLDGSVSDGDPIVTEVRPLGNFYEAEENHRNYYRENSSQPYCQIVISPKLEKLQKEFAEFLKSHGKSG